MRILVVSTPIFRLCPPAGTLGYAGLEVIAWHTAMGLARRGHQVYLVAPEGSQCPGVEVIQSGPAMGHDENQAYNIYWKLMLSLKPDCIVDHTWSKFSYNLKQEGRFPAPILGVMHAPINTMMQSPPPFEKPCFVCISEDQKSHYEALFHPRKARCCYNGVDMTFYQDMKLPRNDRFLFLARFSTIKGPDIAIEACKAAGVGLDLIGDTQITNEPEYLEKLRGMVDGEQIKFVGSATRSECVWWYSRNKCLLHPVKNFREPLGLAPLEAMACNTPVISWRNGAMSETIIHGETGFLVDSLQEMIETIKSKAVDQIDRKRCREWVASKFTVEHMAERYEELCLEAVRTGGW